MGFMRALKNLFAGEDTQRDTYREHDIRGWALKDQSGTTIGRMDDWMVDDDQGRIRYGIVNVNNRHKLVPVGELDVDDHSRTVVARGYTMERFNTLRDYDASTWNETTEREHYRDYHPDWKGDTLDYDSDRFRGHVPRRVQLLEEQLNLGKRAVKTGEVEVNKVKDRRTERVTDQVTRGELVTEGLEHQREATFASAEPTEADLLARKRYEGQRQRDERVDVTPIDDQSQIDRPI